MLLTSNKMDMLKMQENPTAVQSTETECEKNSVDELADTKQARQEKKMISQETTKQDLSNNVSEETEEPEENRQEKATQKSVACTSILTEMFITGEEYIDAHPSPFPIFNKTDVVQSAVGEKEVFLSTKEAKEITFSVEKGESVESNPHSETEWGKSPFPVFHEEKGVPARVTQKPIEKELKTDIEIKLKIEEPVQKGMEISEENKARIALNSTMSKEQIEAIAVQIQAAAKVIMEEEEQAWREQIAVNESVKVTQTIAKAVANSQN